MDTSPFDLLGKTIEVYKHSGHFINKHKTTVGLTCYFAFRKKQNTLYILGKFHNIHLARAVCGKVITHPEKLTPPKSAYAKTSKSRSK